MENTTALIACLRSRLSQDLLSDAEFIEALAEILASTSKGLSGADILMISYELRELEQIWRDNHNGLAN
jgi:uncharacterized protein with von Willebrand factor type A (vWA) domain